MRVTDELNNTTTMPGAYIAPGVIIKDSVFIGHNAVILNNKQEGKATIIQERVEIGANSTIYPGVEIGVNAIIKPGSVVSRSVPPLAIVEGNPARITGYIKTSTSSEFKKFHSQSTLNGNLRPSIVKGVSFHKLKMVPDMRGNLTVGEFENDIPFIPRRYFLVYDVPTTNIDTRGEHAHRNCQQFLIAIKGRINVIADDGQNREEFILNQPNVGLYIPAMIWAVQYRHSNNAVLLVFSSHHYDPNDYIRDYSEFLLLSKLDVTPHIH